MKKRQEIWPDLRNHQLVKINYDLIYFFFQKTPEAGASISVLLEMERRLDKTIREKERIVQKVHDSNLLKEVQTTLSSSERTMFLPLLERLKVHFFGEEPLFCFVLKLRQFFLSLGRSFRN